MKRLLALLVALAIGWLTLPSASSASLIEHGGNLTYTYDLPDYGAPDNDNAEERGPPSVAVADTTHDAVDHRSHGVSARLNGPTTLSIITYDYPASLVRHAQASTTTDAQFVLADGDISSRPASQVAAKAGARAADDAPISWPAHVSNGFHGTKPIDGNPGVTVLKPGALVDRFGFDEGRFVAPNGTPIGQRALAPGTTDKPYSVFEVTNRLVVQRGPAEPWFGQPGMGTQYYLPATVEDLLSAGYLRRVG